MNRSVNFSDNMIMKYHTAKNRFSFLLMLAMLAIPFGLWGESKSVKVGPKNTHPTVTFYSNTPGEIHQLTVNIVSGWEFVSGPTLKPDPDGLWSHAGGRTFSILNSGKNIGSLDDGAGRAEVTAEIKGTIRRIPQGGGEGSGAVEDLRFLVRMLTRYFSMAFVEPFDLRSFCLQGEDGLLVSVTLTNATGGPPADAAVEFFFQNSLASMDADSASYSNGTAQATFTVSSSAAAGSTFKITADASNVDITDEQKATGQRQSQEFLTIVAPEFEILDGSDEPTGIVRARMDKDETSSDYQWLSGKVRLLPTPSNEWKGEAELVLMNEDGRLRFDLGPSKPAPNSGGLDTITVPFEQPGADQVFFLAGNDPSEAIDDAVIEVYPTATAEDSIAEEEMTVWWMRMNINRTETTNDDIVRREYVFNPVNASEVQIREWIPVDLSVIPEVDGLGSETMHVSNADGKLRFSTDQAPGHTTTGENTAIVTLSEHKGNFFVTGVVQSEEMDDTHIQVNLQDGNGDLAKQKAMTVFWFSSTLSRTVTSQSYGIYDVDSSPESKRFGLEDLELHSIQINSEIKILPESIGLSSIQISRLRAAIAQDVYIESYSSQWDFTMPIQWTTDPGENSQNSIDVYDKIERQTSFDSFVRDVAEDAPFHRFASLHPKFGNVNNAFTANGEVTLSFYDTPGFTNIPIEATYQFPYTAIAKYQLNKASIKASFRVFSVIYFTDEDDMDKVIHLEQLNWSLDVENDTNNTKADQVPTALDATSPTHYLVDPDASENSAHESFHEKTTNELKPPMTTYYAPYSD